MRPSISSKSGLALLAVTALEQEHLGWLHLMDIIPLVLLLLLRVCQERVRNLRVLCLSESPVFLAQRRRVAERERVALQRLERLPDLFQIVVSRFIKAAGTPDMQAQRLIPMYHAQVRSPFRRHAKNTKCRPPSKRKVWIITAKAALRFYQEEQTTRNSPARKPSARQIWQPSATPLGIPQGCHRSS